MANKEGMLRFGRMLFESHEHTITLDGPEQDRITRYMAEQAQPEWARANAADGGADPLTPEEVIHSLLIDGLVAAERKAGLVAMIDGRLFTIEGHDAYRRGQKGAPLSHAQELRQRSCPHERTTTAGADNDREVCMDCGKVSEV